MFSETTHEDQCQKCRGEGWLEGKDYVDGSYSWTRECPHCRGTGKEPQSSSDGSAKR